MVKGYLPKAIIRNIGRQAATLPIGNFKVPIEKLSLST
jgi:hypothetical protein